MMTLQTALKQYKKIKIIFNCKLCLNRIETFYDENNILDGNFIGLDTAWSEALEKFVNKDVRCIQCK